MLWVAKAYRRKKKTAQTGDYGPGGGGGDRRGGREGRNYVRQGVLERTINGNLGYIKRYSPYRAVNTVQIIKQPTS